MCELKAYRDAVTEDERTAKRLEFSMKFEVDPHCEEYELDRAARTSVALDKLAEATTSVQWPTTTKVGKETIMKIS